MALKRIVASAAEGPCRQCRVGLHRVCESPRPLPTLLAYVGRDRNLAPETLTCCDQKEFWVELAYS